jgi:hypothetical protein
MKKAKKAGKRHLPNYPLSTNEGHKKPMLKSFIKHVGSISKIMTTIGMIVKTIQRIISEIKERPML